MNQKKTGTILSFLNIFLKIGTTFFYIPFVLEEIGNNNYGLFSIVGSIIAYIAILDFGINDSTLRFFVKYRVEKLETEKMKILGSISSIYAGIAMLIAIVSIAVYFSLNLIFSNSLSVQELILLKQMYAIAVISIFFTILFNPTGAIINAYEKFIILKLSDIIVFMLTTITIVCFLYFDYGVIEMVIISSVYNICNVLFKFLYVRVKLKIKYPTYKPSKKLIKEIALYSGPIFIVIIVETVYWKLDNIIIGSMLGPAMVTFYAMGIVFQKYILSFSTAISRIMTPDLIKKIDTNYSLIKLTDNYIKTSRIQLIVVLIIVLNLVFWGKPFLKIWLGEEYTISYYVLLLIMIPFSLEIIGNLRNVFLQVYGFYWYRAGIILIISVINIGLTIVLTGDFGIIGAAASTCFSLFLGYGITNYLLWKKVGVKISSFFNQVWFKALPIIGLTVLIAVLLSKIIDVDNWLSLALVVICTSSVYAFALWILYLNLKEKEILNKMLNI